MFVVDASNHQKPRFVGGFRRNLQQHRVIPKLLGFNKVDAVLGTTGFAFISY
jgi:hypothetical protein